MNAHYQHFMIFMLHDSGEKDLIDVTRDEFLIDNGKNILLPKQVVLIVDEELRRIYIWKGALSSVRKKFIASRVASELQNELANVPKFHRCKVVSVDQGDEPQEFLHSFGFSSMKVEKTIETKETTTKSYSEKISPKTEITKRSNQNIKGNQPYKLRKPNKFKILSQDQKKRLDIILKSEIPSGFNRQHIILGDNIIYGKVKRKTEVFGKTITEESWNPIDGLNKEMIEFDDYKTRIYFNTNTGIIKAVEFLKPLSPQTSKKNIINYSKWTVKQLKAYCSKNDIKVLSKYRKADIVKLVEEHNKEMSKKS
ncbi:MAG: hypothetical protein EU516_00985 [Promethearchaeota archaeon]|nr:MAG: hypothetical protein EU516_00985 [Candidatus Lokiarchaeota archaeon]